MDVYAENILDHYRNPRFKGEVEDPTVSHSEANHSCGDQLSVSLKISDGKITEIGWQGTGCAISQAAMSMLAEELEGMLVENAEQLSKAEIIELLGVPIGARRTKCALLCLHTLKNALRAATGKDPQSWLQTVEVVEEN